MNLKVSPSYLQMFLNFRNGKYNDTQETLIKKINREAEFLETEAMRKGTAFHKMTENNVPYDGDKVKYGWWDFDAKVVNEIIEERKDFYHEKYVERLIDTRFGPVKLYGYVDDINGGVVQDLKTCANYWGLQYADSVQWKTYLYCTGAHTHTYIITDFTNIYYEEYHWRPENELELKRDIEDYFEFVAMHINEIKHEFISYEK